MELFLVVNEEVGFYDEPSKYKIKGIYTSPEAVIEAIPTYEQREVSIIKFEESQLDKNFNIALNSYFGASNEEIKVQDYNQFIETFGVEKKSTKKLK